MKSQRGSSENIYVKKQRPWPQNHILGGQAKARVSYDGLSWCQWMAGFATIAKKESDLDTKNVMLEYLADLMEDALDSGHQSRAVMPCYCVKWKKEKCNGQMLTKSTALDGHLPNDSLSKALKILRKNQTARECLANSIRRAHASTKRITSRVRVFTSTSVQFVPLKAKRIYMQPKIVGYLVQKTSQALQN